MKCTAGRNFLFILAVVARVSVSPSTAAKTVEKPFIKLISPRDGRVWVSGYAEVTRGYSFVFNCSFNAKCSPGYFFLKFSGPHFSQNYSNNHLDLFNFSAAEYDHEGNYSCACEGNGNQTFSESDPIYVIIKYPLLNLLIYTVVPGAALLLLVLVLVVVLVCRRKGRDRRPEAAILNQTTFKNNSNEDEEEEEEQDYVNVDPEADNRKSNYAVEANEEDENDNDYENPENESDNDYENPENDSDNDYENQYDEDDNVKATKASVIAKDQRKEDRDEEENSSDEHDYINLGESVSQKTLDIYGQEDIYQNC